MAGVVASIADTDDLHPPSPVRHARPPSRVSMPERQNKKGDPTAALSFSPPAGRRCRQADEGRAPTLTRSHPSCRKDADIRALAVPAWPLGSKPEGDEWQEWWRQSRMPTICILPPPFVMPAPEPGIHA